MGAIRILDGGEHRRDRVAKWLMEHPAIGMLFSPGRNEVEGEVPGTFAFDLVGLGQPRRPALVYVLKSSEEADPYGPPGFEIVMGGIPQGGGMHGGLNRCELTTVLMVRSSAFEAGRVDTHPCAIVDIAPTMLDLLGIQWPLTMTGRSLVRQRRPPPVRRLSAAHSAFHQCVQIAGEGRTGILVHGSSGEPAAP
jgi:hypothetical protein